MRLKPRLKPGRHHPITIAPAEERVLVRFGDRVVADSGRALVLSESRHRPVLYVPREDVLTEVLEPSAHRTYCPYKGDATYFHLREGDRVAEDAVWTYVTPHDAVAEIAGHVAFDPELVEIEHGPTTPRSA